MKTGQMIRGDIERARIPRRTPEEHEEKLSRSSSYVWRLLVIVIALATAAELMHLLGAA